MRAPVRVSSFLHDMGGWGADSVQQLILVYVDEGLQPTTELICNHSATA